MIAFKFVPINNKPTLVYLMARHWAGNKPLFEPMMTYFPDA